MAVMIKLPKTAKHYAEKRAKAFTSFQWSLILALGSLYAILDVQNRWWSLDWIFFILAPVNFIVCIAELMNWHLMKQKQRHAELTEKLRGTENDSSAD